MGGNGSCNMDSFFQEEKLIGKNPQPFAEKRTKARSIHNHSPENKALLEDIREIVHCKSGDCNIHPDLRGHTGHMAGAYKQKSGISKDVSVGIDNDVDQYKRLEKHFKRLDKIVSAVTITVLCSVAVAIVWALWETFKGKVG